MINKNVLNITLLFLGFILVINVVQAKALVIERELISNTDNCLTDCKLKFRFRLNKKMPMNVITSLRHTFVRGEGFDYFRDSGIRLQEKVTYYENECNTCEYETLSCDPNTYKNCKNKIVTGKSCSKCGFHRVKKSKWEYRDFDPRDHKGEFFEPNVWYYVEIWGKKKLKLGRNDVDIRPLIFGVEIKEMAWWNTSYNYRYLINTTATSIVPFSVNDTWGIGGTDKIFWTLNASSGEPIYAYCENSGCSSGLVAIANETDEKYWENETDSSGNSPTSVWIYDSSLKAVYHMEKTQDDDSTGNGFDLVTYGGDPTTNASGVFGTANDLDGTGDYYESNVPMIVDNFTISFWFYPDKFGSTQALIRNYDGSSQSINIWFGSNGEFKFDTWDSGGNDANDTPTNVVTKSDWYFLTFVYDGTNGRKYVYVNATCFACSSGTFGTLISTNENITIGKLTNYVSTYEFDGKLDEFRIYHEAKSQTWVQEQFNNGINSLSLLGSEETSADTTPPQSFDNSTNETIAGNVNLFSLRWTDNTGLDSYIFSTNNTGTWTNDTATTMTGTEDWSNVTKTLNSTAGTYIEWIVYANDTSDNWNTSATYFLTTTSPAPTPTLVVDYCQLLWMEKHKVSNHGICLTDNILYKNITYQITENSNVTTLFQEYNETCNYGCDNRTGTCYPNPIQQDIWMVGIIVAVIVALIILPSLLDKISRR